MTKQELYDFILNNRMAYHRIIKASNRPLHDEIVNKYPEAKNKGEAFWLYCHDHDDVLRCACGAHLLFENVVNGYKASKCLECYRKDAHDNSKAVKTVESQSGQPHPECAHPDCSKPVMTYPNGVWADYCSRSCTNSHNSLRSRTKSKATMMKNHGVEHALQSPTIMGKMQANLLEKHQASNVMRVPTIAKQVVATKVLRYGQKSNWSDPIEYQRVVDEIAKGFGYDVGQFTNSSQIPEIQAKKMQSQFLSKDYTLPSGRVIRCQGHEPFFLNQALQFYSEDFFNWDQISIPYQFEGKTRHYHPDFFVDLYNEIIEVKSAYTFFADYDKNIAKANGVVTSGMNFSFCVYRQTGEMQAVISYSANRTAIESFLVENKITFTDHHQIGPHIVDFYLPESNIAIVYRSVRFTSEVFLPPNFYAEMHRSLELQGIQLITVNDAEMSPAWFRSLSNKANTSTTRIHARKCVVQRIKKGAKKFLDDNHIQGHAAATFQYGLFYQNELVAVMGFNSPRRGIGGKHEPGTYELVRYASSVRVTGGASKLLSHFVAEMHPYKIISFSDNSISTGQLYRTLGFTCDNESGAGYSYIRFNGSTVSHRSKFAKGKLENLLEVYDETLTERILMKMNGYLKIYDCGKRRWTLHFSEKVRIGA